VDEPNTSYLEPETNNRWRDDDHVLGDPIRGLHFTWDGPAVNGR
jgi:hypothetical protein